MSMYLNLDAHLQICCIMCDEEPGTDSEEETLDDESGCSSSESESTVDAEQVDLTGEDQVADRR